MTCGGCSGAISRVLTKAQNEGTIQEFSVDLDSQRVQVVPVTASYEDVYERIKKTGKAINIGKNGDQEAITYTPRGEERLSEFLAASPAKAAATA